MELSAFICMSLINGRGYKKYKYEMELDKDKDKDKDKGKYIRKHDLTKNGVQ